MIRKTDVNVTKRDLSDADVRRELKRFEEKYGLASKDFYAKFNRGELGDEEDFFEWATLWDVVAAKPRTRKSA